MQESSLRSSKGKQRTKIQTDIRGELSAVGFQAERTIGDGRCQVCQLSTFLTLSLSLSLSRYSVARLHLRYEEGKKRKLKPPLTDFQFQFCEMQQGETKKTDKWAF
ncbi:unnamed protein product [Linum trigynum]|uniref:Uncharacterized protein n=1 Tax=Linum trigynum TaxID=586398 RepID=A0AAV2FG79_9ROSI